MAILCANALKFSDKVDSLIDQHEKTLKDTHPTTAVAQSIKDTLEELHGYRDALKNNDLEYVNAQGFAKDADIQKSAVLEEAFRDEIGEKFTFTKGTATKPHEGRLLSVKAGKGGMHVTFVAKGETHKRVFSWTSDGRSNDDDNNTNIYINGIRPALDHYHLAMASAEHLALVLGSSNSNFQLDKKFKQDDYKHGDINHMKTMLKKLHLLGGEKASQAELDSHLALLDKMGHSFFNKLSLYVNDAADRSEGVARARRIDIKVSNTPRSAGNQQSEASIYMEEVIHSMTAAAMASNTLQANKLKRQLATIMEVVRKNLKVEDLLPTNSIDPSTERKTAEWLMSYILDHKNADYELIAKALAVPEVGNALKDIQVKEGPREKKRLMERINDFFSAVVDILRGNFTLRQTNEDVHTALVNLAFEFAEINKTAARKSKEDGGYISAVFDVVNNLDDKLSQAVVDGRDKLFGDAKASEIGPKPKNLYGKVKWYAKFFAYAFMNPVYAKAMGAVATAWGVKPGGTIREILSGLAASDSAQKVAEFLTMQSGYIDKLRNNQIDITRKAVLSEFSDFRKVTVEQQEALTEVIADTDLSGLFGKDSVAKSRNISKTVYDNKTIRNLLSDDVVLERYIKHAKGALKELDPAHYHWHSNQSVGLGIYMATHNATPEQNLNAHNIAEGIHSTHSKKARREVVRAIDELSTLVAIKNTDLAKRLEVAELMRTEWKGVQHIADMLEGFKVNSNETVFKGKKTHKIKGYTREVFDDSIVMEVAPKEDEAKMKAKGFTMRSTLAPRAGDKRNKVMALYITSTSSRSERLRGGVRLNTISAKGTSITATAYKDGEGISTQLIRERARRDINNIQREASKRAELMEKGEYDFKDTVFGVSPVLDEHGNVTDYRYTMDKATKKTLLGQDTRITEVVARSFGAILDKAASAEHNAKALDIIKKDMVENWSGGTKGRDGLTDYTLIGPAVADPEMRKLYYMLPHDMQEFVKNREDKVMAVQSSLMHIMFGYTQLSFMDFPMLSKVTPQVLQRFIRFAESVWFDVIKIAKANILIKMPTILLSNLLSNFLYAALRGYDPIRVSKMYLESYRDISTYNKGVKRVQELENRKRQINAALKRDTTTPQRKKSLELELRKVKGEIGTAKRRISESPIHELVKLGMDQNVEDVTNDTARDSNRIVNYFDEKLAKAPDLVRSGVDIMFITKRTKFYQVANEFLEVSDLAARDVQNRLEKEVEQKQADGKRMLPKWWLEKQADGYPRKQKLTGEERRIFLEEAKENRQYELVEDYINYTKPSSRFEEYLNRVGILMFTKYVKRIQRIITKATANSPIKALTGISLFAYLGGFPSIHEQSFLAKDWYTDSIGPGNVFPVYSPVDNLMNILTPATVKLMDGRF